MYGKNHGILQSFITVIKFWKERKKLFTFVPKCLR